MNTLFEINTDSPKVNTIKTDKVAALKQALIESGLRVCGLGKNKRGIFATATSKLPCWKIEFNSAGEIVRVTKRNWTKKCWEEGEEPLSHYREVAKHIFKKADEVKVAQYHEQKAAAVGAGI